MSLLHHPEHRELFTRTDQGDDPGRVQTPEQEDQFEADCRALMDEVVFYATRYGAAKTLHTVAEALAEMRGLFK